MLDNLVETGHLNEIPANPRPGGRRYLYTLSADYSSYSLEYELEGQKGMYSAGFQVATQDTMSVKDSPQELIEEAIEELNGQLEEGVDGVSTTTVEQDAEGEVGIVDGEDVLIQEEIRGKMQNDADGDGLYDSEEALLGTRSDLRDSDGDGYDDSEEVMTLNNPNGVGSISENINVVKYINANLKYEFYYPIGWSPTLLSGGDSLMFRTEDSQSIQILSPHNAQLLSLEEWYAIEVSARKIKDTQKISRNGWDGLYSSDGLTVYLGYPGDDRVYVVSYSTGFNAVENYKSIFMMIVNSFKFVDKAVQIMPDVNIVATTSTSTQVVMATSTSTAEELIATSSLDEIVMATSTDEIATTSEEVATTTSEVVEEETGAEGIILVNAKSQVDGSAIINWYTERDYVCYVDYSVNASMANASTNSYETKLNMQGLYNYTGRISGLVEDAKYYYRVNCTNQMKSFQSPIIYVKKTTNDAGFINIFNIRAEDMGGNDIEITWSTDKEYTCNTKYYSENGSQSVVTTAFQNSNLFENGVYRYSVDLTALEDFSSYKYKVICEKSGGEFNETSYLSL